MEYPPQIQALIEKYWNAETSLEEEKELRNYFLLHEDHSDPNAAYFRFLKAEREIETPVVQPLPARRINLRYKKWLSMAAAVIVLVVAGLFIQREMQRDVNSAPTAADTFEDPESAYEEAKQALLLVSMKMQQTQEKASTEIEKVRPYTEILK